MPKKKSARVPQPSRKQISEVWSRIQARVDRAKQSFEAVGLPGHFRPDYEHAAFTELVAELKENLYDEVHKHGLAALVKLAETLLLAKHPALPTPSASNEYVFVARVTRELTGLYALDGVEVVASGVEEARRAIESYDAANKLPLKFEKCITKQPLNVLFTARRPVEAEVTGPKGEPT